MLTLSKSQEPLGDKFNAVVGQAGTVQEAFQN